MMKQSSKQFRNVHPMRSSGKLLREGARGKERGDNPPAPGRVCWAGASAGATAVCHFVQAVPTASGPKARLVLALSHEAPILHVPKTPQAAQGSFFPLPAPSTPAAQFSERAGGGAATPTGTSRMGPLRGNPLTGWKIPMCPSPSAPRPRAGTAPCLAPVSLTLAQEKALHTAGANAGPEGFPSAHSATRVVLKTILAQAFLPWLPVIWCRAAVFVLCVRVRISKPQQIFRTRFLSFFFFPPSVPFGCGI